jgi:DNA polymerase/3'-5' exonuclease PolX
MHEFGLRHVDGHVERVATGEVVPTPTEEDFFRLAGLPFLPPAKRDSRAAFVPLPNAPARPAEVTL